LAHYESQNVINAMAALSTSITSYAATVNETWPDTTIPHWEIRGMKNNILSKAIQVTFVPLVKKEELAVWEEYSVQNQGWIAEGLEVQADLALLAQQNGVNDEEEGHGGHRRAGEVATDSDAAATSDVLVPPINPRIWKYSEYDGEHGVGAVSQDGPGVDFGPAQYAPVWQQSPAPSNPEIINFDLLSHPVFKRIYHGLWETRLPVFSEVMNVEFIYGTAVHDKIEHPHSFLMSPVYPFFSNGKLHERDDLSGLLLAIMPWDTYFENVLVEGVNGMIVGTYKSNRPVELKLRIFQILRLLTTTLSLSFVQSFTIRAVTTSPTVLTVPKRSSWATAIFTIRSTMPWRSIPSLLLS